MTHEDRPIRVAIVGAGGMGSRHAACWQRVTGAQVVAIVDRKPAKADRIADSVSGIRPTTFCEVDDLVSSDVAVDVVSLCLPTVVHRSCAEQLLGSGKHVLCEKPLALTVEDCDAMDLAATAADRLLGVAQVVRFFPEYALARTMVESGAVGKPAAVRTRRGGDFPRADTDWYADTALSGGVVFDLLIHDIDWAQWCFGPIVRVYAQGLTERLAIKEVDHLDYALLTCRHGSGVISHLEGTWADPGGFVTSFEIAGDGGLLTHDSRTHATVRGSVRAEPGQPAHPTGAVPSALNPDDNPYFRQIAAFAAAVRRNTPVPVSARDGRQAVAVAAAARESMRTGLAVQLGGEGTEQ